MHGLPESCSLRNTAYKRIWIVGASHNAREMMGFLRDIQQHQETDIPVAGFLDDGMAGKKEIIREKLFPFDFTILPAKDYVPRSGDLFLNSIGTPENKQRVVPKLLQKGATFITLVHPTVHFGYNNSVGLGCIFQPYSVCTTNIHFGNFISIGSYCLVADDVTIGDFSTLMTRSFAGSGSAIGKLVCMNTGSSTMEYTVIEDRATIGVHSVILRKAKTGCVYFGLPAKPIGQTEQNKNFTLILCKAQEKDVKFVFDLVNDDLARTMSLGGSRITMEEHETWFRQRLRNGNPFYIGYCDNTPCGYVRFDDKEGDIFISVAIAGKFRGRGIGSAMISASCRAVLLMKAASCIHADIKSTNTASLRAFQKAWFVPAADTGTPDVIRLRYPEQVKNTDCYGRKVAG
ncbi:MAG: GNAT family N-acetyltransferase [Desulfovibrio sp.]|nr:GNAT family N-acetyltransferase [Desulfovibrio sp.]